VNSADPALASVPAVRSRNGRGNCRHLRRACVREGQHPRPGACTHVAHATGDGRVRDGQMARRVRLAAAGTPAPQTVTVEKKSMLKQ
jgi:hypothetical protein